MLLNCSSADCRFSVSSKLSSSSPQHKEILDHICMRLGQSESETPRIAFLEYAKSISLITEKVQELRSIFEEVSL